MKQLRALSIVEIKLGLREPFAVFFALVFPLILVLMFGAAFGNYPASPGFRVADVAVPSTIVLVGAYLGFMGIPIVFAEYREMGVLRHFRVTPLRMATLIAAHIVAELMLLAAATALVIIVTASVFGLRFGGNVFGFFAVLMLCVFALFAVGFALAGQVSSSRAAQGLGSIVYFPLLFTSGAAVPRSQFPSWLQDATEWLPLTRVVETLEDSWIGAPVDGQFITSLVIFGVVALLSIALTRRTFRWE